jgi:hypothetical protein
MFSKLFFYIDSNIYCINSKIYFLDLDIYCIDSKTVIVKILKKY